MSDDFLLAPFQNKYEPPVTSQSPVLAVAELLDGLVQRAWEEVEQLWAELDSFVKFYFAFQNQHFALQGPL